VKTTSAAVTVNNLKPGTLYIFQIRTSSSPDYGNHSPSIEVETLAECKCWQGSSSLTHAGVKHELYRGDAAACCSCPRCFWLCGAASVPLILLLWV